MYSVSQSLDLYLPAAPQCLIFQSLVYMCSFEAHKLEKVFLGALPSVLNMKQCHAHRTRCSTSLHRLTVVNFVTNSIYGLNLMLPKTFANIKHCYVRLSDLYNCGLKVVLN